MIINDESTAYTFVALDTVTECSNLVLNRFICQVKVDYS